MFILKLLAVFWNHRKSSVRIELETALFICHNFVREVEMGGIAALEGLGALHSEVMCMIPHTWLRLALEDPLGDRFSFLFFMEWWCFVNLENFCQ